MLAPKTKTLKGFWVNRVFFFQLSEDSQRRGTVVFFCIFSKLIFNCFKKNTT